jgi:hypothetical protein
MLISVTWLCSDNSEFPLIVTDFPSLYPRDWLLLDLYPLVIHIHLCKWLIRLFQSQAVKSSGPDFSPRPHSFYICLSFDRPTPLFAQMMDAVWLPVKSVYSLPTRCLVPKRQQIQVLCFRTEHYLPWNFLPAKLVGTEVVHKTLWRYVHFRVTRPLCWTSSSTS